MLKIDLSNYIHPWNKVEVPGMLAVGWIDPQNGYPINSAKIDSAVIDKLRLLSTLNFNAVIMRGFEPCSICSEYYEKENKYSKMGKLLLGNAELWIPFNGKIYAAPDLVLHYIEDHNYLPPNEYLDAILQVDINKKIDIAAFDQALMDEEVNRYIEADWLKK